MLSRYRKLIRQRVLRKLEAPSESARFDRFGVCPVCVSTSDDCLVRHLTRLRHGGTAPGKRTGRGRSVTYRRCSQCTFRSNQVEHHAVEVIASRATSNYLGFVVFTRRIEVFALAPNVSFADPVPRHVARTSASVLAQDIQLDFDKTCDCYLCSSCYLMLPES